MFQSSEKTNTVRFIVSTANGKEEVKLFKQDELYYAFLPSYANNENTTIVTDNEYTLYIDDQQYISNSDIKELCFDKEYSIELKNFLGLTLSKEKLVLMKSENIPAISIQLVDGTLSDLDEDKDIEKSGAITVINEDSSVDFSGSFRSLKSRGNASWLANKKPYKLEFDTEINLLGMGANKEWVLLANAYDASNLKNKLIFEAAKQLGIRYVSNTQFVDLYINGEYRGLYLLAEKIEIGSNSVDIYNLGSNTQSLNFQKLSSYDIINIENQVNGSSHFKAYNIPNNPDDITGGYILKSESEDRIKDDSYFVTSSSATFACESPKYASVEQMKYISNIFDELINNLGNYEITTEIIDVNSFVKRYLINECFANYESSSNYFIKDSNAVDSKLYAEPVWDFDAAWGAKKTTNPIGIYNYSDFVGKVIYSDPALFEQVKKMYFSEMVPILQYTFSSIPKYEKYISDSDQMNKIRWKSIFDETQSLDKQVRFLSDYLEQRTNFLNDYWTDTSKYAILSFVDTGYYYTYAISAGSYANNINALEKDGYTFLGWYDQTTGEPLTLDKPIYGHHEYRPKWEIIEPNSNDEFGINSVISKAKATLSIVKKDIEVYFSYTLVVVLSLLLVMLIIKDLLIHKIRRKK